MRHIRSAVLHDDQIKNGTYFTTSDAEIEFERIEESMVHLRINSCYFNKKDIKELITFLKKLRKEMTKEGAL